MMDGPVLSVALTCRFRHADQTFFETQEEDAREFLETQGKNLQKQWELLQ